MQHILTRDKLVELMPSGTANVQDAEVSIDFALLPDSPKKSQWVIYLSFRLLDRGVASIPLYMYSAKLGPAIVWLQKMLSFIVPPSFTAIGTKLSNIPCRVLYRHSDSSICAFGHKYADRFVWWNHLMNLTPDELLEESESL